MNKKFKHISNIAVINFLELYNAKKKFLNKIYVKLNNYIKLSNIKILIIYNLADISLLPKKLKLTLINFLKPNNIAIFQTNNNDKLKYYEIIFANNNFVTVFEIKQKVNKLILIYFNNNDNNDNIFDIIKQYLQEKYFYKNSYKNNILLITILKNSYLTPNINLFRTNLNINKKIFEHYYKNNDNNDKIINVYKTGPKFHLKCFINEHNNFIPLKISIYKR